MKLGFSQQQIIDTAESLGLPTDGFVQRRVARAFDLVETDKVTEVTDGIFRVRSQYDASKAYIVNVNHGAPMCDCPDGERTINCKHRIASLLWMQKHEAKALIIKEIERPNVSRAWFIIDGKRRIMMWQDLNGKVCCNCGAYYDSDCRHKQAIRGALNNGEKVLQNAVVRPLSPPRASPKNLYGNGSKITNECGSEKAKQLQDKLNGNNGNGDNQSPSQPTVSRRRRLLLAQLEISDPFQECELKDIAQVEGAVDAPSDEGRGNGEWAHRLSNGEYVVSYRGVMGLAEKHDIEFELATHDDTNTIIAKGRRNGSERVSGKPINGSVKTSGELAKRNCARQLLPFAEIKVLELKAKLEADFSGKFDTATPADWEKAKAKCVELVGTEANVDIIIHELVQAGDLRQDNPSGFDTPRGYSTQAYNRIEWLIIHNACKKDREQSDDNDGGDNSPPSMVICGERPACSEARDPQSLNRWSYNSDAFIEKCREAIQKVRDGKVAEANEMPSQSSNGKRKLQMDSKLRTWLIEADGTNKKSISCREICLEYDPKIVSRLRAGIDSGADISTVEID